MSVNLRDVNIGWHTGIERVEFEKEDENMNDECYACTFSIGRLVFDGKRFNTFEEAKEKGIEVSKDFNRNYKKNGYVPDKENVFSDELQCFLKSNALELWEKAVKENGREMPENLMTQFYIVKLEKHKFPNFLGEKITRCLADKKMYISGDEMCLTDEEKKSDKTVGEIIVERLNNTIYDYLNENFSGCALATVTVMGTVIVE